MKKIEQSGVLIVRSHKETPFYEAKWRDSTGRQRKRRLGQAWVRRSGEGWVGRRGYPTDGSLPEAAAHLAMSELIETEERALAHIDPAHSQVTFAEAARAWLEYVEFEKRLMPSTLSWYRAMVSDGGVASLQRTPTRARGQALIMGEFGDRRIAEIRTEDIHRFLSKLDREEITAGMVNLHRQVLNSVFEFAKEAFGLATNPVAWTSKRPEATARPFETFELRELQAIVAAARRGKYRLRVDEHSAFSEETKREWQRINDQDAAIFIIAAFTGLHIGEIAALRWSDLDLEGHLMTVSRTISLGKEMSTKSWRLRSVPLAEQALVELRALRQRDDFRGPSDHVFCRADGSPIKGRTPSTRFSKAQEEAGVRVRRFADLRHTFGSLAVRQFNVARVKSMMGHAKLSTTERYLHSKPRPHDALLLTEIFEGEDAEAD
jgi:integrase